MTARTSSSWSPDYADVWIERPRDVKLTTEALQYAASEGSDMAERILKRSFISREADGDMVAQTDAVFRREETPVVVGALAKHIAENLGTKPLLRRRAISLIGSLVVSADTEYTRSQLK